MNLNHSFSSTQLNQPCTYLPSTSSSSSANPTTRRYTTTFALPLPGIDFSTLLAAWKNLNHLKKEPTLSIRLDNLSDRAWFMQHQATQQHHLRQQQPPPQHQLPSQQPSWKTFSSSSSSAPNTIIPTSTSTQHDLNNSPSHSMALPLYPHQTVPLSSWPSSQPPVPPTWPTLYHPLPSQPPVSSANQNYLTSLLRHPQPLLPQQQQTSFALDSGLPPTGPSFASGSQSTLSISTPATPSFAPLSPPIHQQSQPSADDANPSNSFHSSFGPYQPVSGPYPRFLTPSPGPSLLGMFDEDSFDEQGTGGGTSESYEEMWKEFNEANEGGSETRKEDPWEGLVVAGSSGLKREEGLDDGGDALMHPSSSIVPPGINGAPTPSEPIQIAPQPPTFPSTSSSFAVPMVASPASHSSSSSTHPLQLMPMTIAEEELESPSFQPSEHSTHSPASDDVYHPTPPPLPKKKRSRKSSTDVAGSSNGSGGKVSGGIRGSKKNRNPHATAVGTVVGDGEEAGEVSGRGKAECTHCGSVVTPLWRRGPSDELLCNACGLYLKLHSKPRPKTFGGKQPAAPRKGSVGATIAAGGTPMCFNCEATSTPMWRKDKEGNLACNACSLYYKLHNVVRPVSLSLKQKSRLAAMTNLAASSSSSAPAPKNRKARETSSPPPSPPLEPLDFSLPPQPVLNLALPPLPPSATYQPTSPVYRSPLNLPSLPLPMESGDREEEERARKRLRTGEESWEMRPDVGYGNGAVNGNSSNGLLAEVLAAAAGGQNGRSWMQ